MIWMAPLVALAGFVLYLLSSNPKAQRIGEICFFCGLLAFLIAFPYTMHLPYPPTR